MDIFDTDKLILFILFAIPGFISIKIYQLTTPGTLRPVADELIDAVFYSSVNYAIMFVPIIFVEDSSLKENYEYLYLIFYLFTLFIAPILWVFALKYIRTGDVFQRYAPHPTTKPWDFVFSQKKTYWMRIHLKDGTVLGGLYGFNSFTSSSPAPEQIYLEECWVLNEKEGFERKQNDTAGLLVIGNDISYIELVTYNDGE